MKAVAGSDIKPGMWIRTSPELEAFQVHAIVPAKSTPLLQVLIDMNAERHVVEKNAWYAEVPL